jgi:hypothetical protein
MRGWICLLCRIFFLGVSGWDDSDINEVKATVCVCLERTVDVELGMIFSAWCSRLERHVSCSFIITFSIVLIFKCLFWNININ